MWILPLLLLLTAQPDAREKARELLDDTAAMLGTLQPDLQVAGLMHLADCYQELDKGKAAEYMRQAFAASAALPEDSDRGFRCRMQREIIQKTADVSAADAAEMLRGMAEPVKDPDTRVSAAEKVVEVLLARSDFQTAIEVVGLLPASGYPYAAAERIFEKLPKDDARRIVVFGNALEAWKRSGAGAFPQMVTQHWQEVPRQMAEAAVAAVVSAILERKDDLSKAETLSAGNKTIRLKSRHSRELFDIMGPLRALDPKRADDLMAKYTDLRAAVERFPGGRREATGFGMENVDGSASWNNRFGSDDDDMDVGIASMAAMFGGEYNEKSAARAQKATERLSAVLAEKDPRKALGMVASIPLPAMRALALARIARSLGGKDPEAARGTLSKCMSLIEDLKEPGDRYVGWLPAAEAAHELKDDPLAWDALEHAMAEVKTLYRQDVDKDNRAMRGLWPSTQSCRLAAWRAAKLMGGRAEALLEGIGDPGLTVVARIEIARALLDKPVSEMAMEFVYIGK